MLGFLRGDADCLVTTTIIESGLDIPTANTLIVERADQLGLSQAYQIRGRVGRSRERAFAYLLYPSAEALTEEAAARLSTLADHTELGSGFRIAMRDLDIRGAGNLLGDEQSGHVAAVGFELYCQMIDEAVAEAGAAEEGERRGGAGAGPPRRPGRRLPAGHLRPLRGGQDRHPPPHRRRPRAGPAAGDPRRAQRPLRAAAAAGREPAEAAAGADRARPGRRPQRRVPRRPAQRHRGRAGLRGRRGARRAGRGSALRMARADRRGPGRRRPGGAPGGGAGAGRGPARGAAAERGRRGLSLPPLDHSSASLSQFDYAARFVGAKPGQSRKSADGSALRWFVFGALFVVLFAGFAIAQGLGHPSVPSGDVAIVEHVPDDIGSVSEADFKRALLQQAAQAKLKKHAETGRRQIRRTEGQRRWANSSTRSGSRARPKNSASR